MSAMMLEPATDWTGQLNEERLRLCAETLFIHDLINDRTYHQAAAKIRDRADIQRERRVGLRVGMWSGARPNAGQ